MNPELDFAASLAQSNYDLNALRQNLDPSVDLKLNADKSVYRNTKAFKDVDEESFNKWYDGVTEAYNVYSKEKSIGLSNPVVLSLFDTPESRALKATNPNINIGKNISESYQENVFGITRGLLGPDQFKQNVSLREAAQINDKIYDNEKKDFVKTGGPVGSFTNFMNYLDRGLIIATDESGTPKLDNFNRPYYETIDGKDITGKEALIATADNFLTEEGSFLNSLDFMDSDQVEANTARSILKNVAKVAFAYAPYTRQVFGATTAMLGMSDMFAEGWKTLSSGVNYLSGEEYKPDADTERKANKISNMARSLTWGSVTDEEQENPLSVASISNMLGDVLTQLSTQRFLATAPIALKSISSPAFRTALMNGDKSAQSFVNLSKNIARTYMTGQAAMGVGEEFEQAGLDKGTKDMAMGIAALAFGALYKTAPFDWMLDGIGVNAMQKATKNLMAKEVKGLAQTIAGQTLTETQKKAVITKGMTGIYNKVKESIANNNLTQTAKGFVGESLEESSELVMSEAIKTGFQYLGKNNLIKADSKALAKLDPFGKDFLQDLALSASLGGVAGGGMGFVSDYRDNKQANSIKDYADIVQNGTTLYALEELEKLRKLGKTNNGIVSDKLSLDIERIGENGPIYKPVGKDSVSQNDFVINSVKQQLLSTKFALSSIGADKEGLDKKLAQFDPLFASISKSAKDSAIISDIKDVSRNIVSLRNEIDTITNNFAKVIAGSDPKGMDDANREELKTQLEPLQKKLAQYEERYKELQTVGVEKSELAEQYLKETLFATNPMAWSGFGVKKESDFLAETDDATEAKQLWNEYKLTQRPKDIRKAYIDAKNLYDNSPFIKDVTESKRLKNLLDNYKLNQTLSTRNTKLAKGEDASIEDVQIEAILASPDFNLTDESLDNIKFKSNDLEFDESNYNDVVWDYLSKKYIELGENGTSSISPLEELLNLASAKTKDEFIADYPVYLNNEAYEPDEGKLYDELKQISQLAPVKFAKLLAGKRATVEPSIGIKDIDALIKVQTNLYNQEGEQYKDVDPTNPVNANQLKAGLKELDNLIAVLEFPKRINPLINKAKENNKDLFGNTELDVVIEDEDQINYLETYLRDKKMRLLSLLEILEENSKTDSKLIKAQHIIGLAKRIQNLVKKGLISITDNYDNLATMSLPEALKLTDLEAQGEAMYKTLVKISDDLKNKNLPLLPVSSISVTDMDNNANQLYNSLLRINYGKFLDSYHKAKEQSTVTPTLEQEMLILQSCALIKAGMLGEIPIEENSFNNAIFIDGSPGIGKTSVIIDYIGKIVGEYTITSKNDGVVTNILEPKFGAKAKSFDTLGIKPSAEPLVQAQGNPIRPHLEFKRPSGALTKVVIIDEATNLSSRDVEALGKVSDTVFIFVGDSTQSGHVDTIEVDLNVPDPSNPGKTMVAKRPYSESFFQYTKGLEKTPRLGLSLRNTTENYDLNAKILEKLLIKFVTADPSTLSKQYDEYVAKKDQQLSFVYEETDKLFRGVKGVTDTTAEYERLKNLYPDATFAIISDTSKTFPTDTKTKVLKSNQIQGQEFDFVIVDSIVYDATVATSVIEKTKLINTLLSRYKQGMVINTTIPDMYPMSFRAAKVTNIIKIGPTDVTALRDFSLALTKSFKTGAATTSTSNTGTGATSSSGLVNLGGTGKTPINDIIEPTIPKVANQKSYIYEGIDLVLNNVKYNGVGGVINFLSEIAKDNKHNNYKYSVQNRPYNGKDTRKLVVTINDTEHVLLTFDNLNIPLTKDISYDNVKKLIQTASLDNSANPKLTGSVPAFDGFQTLANNHVLASTPMIIAISTSHLEYLVDQELKRLKVSDADKNRIRPVLLEQLSQLNGQTVSFISASREYKKVIANFNKNPKNESEANNLFKTNIESEIKRLLGIRNLNQIKTINLHKKSGQTFFSLIQNYNSNKDKFHQIEYSDIRRFGQLIYHYMKEKVDAGEPMEDPLFAALASWTLLDAYKHDISGIPFESEKGRSALAHLYGFAYVNSKLVGVNENGPYDIERKVPDLVAPRLTRDKENRITTFDLIRELEGRFSVTMSTTNKTLPLLEKLLTIPTPTKAEKDLINYLKSDLNAKVYKQVRTDNEVGMVLDETITNFTVQASRADTKPIIYLLNQTVDEVFGTNSPTSAVVPTTLNESGSTLTPEALTGSNADDTNESSVTIVDTQNSTFLSYNLYDEIINSYYDRNEETGILKHKSKEISFEQIIRLIYGSQPDSLLLSGITRLNSSIMSKLFFYDPLTGAVLDDYYSEEGLAKFNQLIHSELNETKDILMTYLGVDKTNPRHEEVLYHLIQNYTSEPGHELYPTIAYYLTLTNLPHILNFKVFKGISDILKVTSIKGDDNIVRHTYTPINKVKDVSYMSQSDARDAVGGYSSFIKYYLNHLPSFTVINGEPVKSQAQSNSVNILNYFNKLKSDENYLDANGTLDISKIKEDYEDLSRSNNAEAVANLYILFYSDTPVTVNGVTIHSLNSIQQKLTLDNVKESLEKNQIFSNFRAAFNIFGKLQINDIQFIQEGAIANKTANAENSVVAAIMDQLSDKDANYFKNTELGDILRLVGADTIDNNIEKVYKTLQNKVSPTELRQFAKKIVKVNQQLLNINTLSMKKADGNNMAMSSGSTGSTRANFKSSC